MPIQIIVPYRSWASKRCSNVNLQDLYYNPSVIWSKSKPAEFQVDIEIKSSPVTFRSFTIELSSWACLKGPASFWHLDPSPFSEGEQSSKSSHGEGSLFWTYYTTMYTWSHTLHQHPPTQPIHLVAPLTLSWSPKCWHYTQDKFNETKLSRKIVHSQSWDSSLARARQLWLSKLSVYHHSTEGNILDFESPNAKNKWWHHSMSPPFVHNYCFFYGCCLWTLPPLRYEWGQLAVTGVG